MNLPPPQGKFGYTSNQILEICKDRGISPAEFSVAFGIQTIAMDNGEMNFYECDVERALWKLGKGGKYHEED